MYREREGESVRGYGRKNTERTEKGALEKEEKHEQKGGGEGEEKGASLLASMLSPSFFKAMNKKKE